MESLHIHIRDRDRVDMTLTAQVGGFFALGNIFKNGRFEFFDTLDFSVKIGNERFAATFEPKQ